MKNDDFKDKRKLAAAFVPVVSVLPHQQPEAREQGYVPIINPPPFNLVGDVKAIFREWKKIRESNAVSLER